MFLEDVGDEQDVTEPADKHGKGGDVRRGRTPLGADRPLGQSLHTRAGQTDRPLNPKRSAHIGLFSSLLCVECQRSCPGPRGLPPLPSFCYTKASLQT